MKPNHKKRIQLITPYRSPIHNKIWTITIKLANQIQKLKNISCQRNCLNFIHFLSIQLQSAENQRIKYNHKQTSNIVWNITINHQSQTFWPIQALFESHELPNFIQLCNNPKTHAHITNDISKFLNFTLEHANKYKIGNNKVHRIADIKIHRFCSDDNIQK